jgi:hypothetical protein
MNGSEAGRENCSYNEAVDIASLGAECSYVRTLMLYNNGKEKFPVLLVEQQSDHLTEFFHQIMSQTVESTNKN